MLQLSGSKQGSLTQQQCKGLPYLRENDHENSFKNDLSYQLVRGHPANGIVVLYPDKHTLGDVENAKNSPVFEEIFEHQVDIYKQFQIKKPEHIYCEGITKEYIALSEQLISKNDIVGNVSFIAELIKKGKVLSLEQKIFFMRVNVGMFHKIVSHLNGLEVSLYPTTAAENEGKVAEIAQKYTCIEEMSLKDKHFIFFKREQEMITAVNDTQSLRKGQPAYVLMGAAHTFDGFFTEKNASAFYRYHRII